MEKYCKAGQATDDNMAHAPCMLDIYGQKHTQRLCHNYSFSTATVVARTRLNVTFIRALPVLSWFLKVLMCVFEYAFDLIGFPEGKIRLVNPRVC